MEVVKLIIKFLKGIDFKKFFAFWVFNTCLSWLWWLSYMTLTGKVKSSDVSEIKMSLIALMTACVYYFFGSSSSSHSKDQTIAGQMNASKSPTKIDVANIEQVTNVDELDSEKRPPIGFKRPPV